MPSVVSFEVPTAFRAAPRSSASLPLSNLVVDENSRVAAGAGVETAALLVVQRAAEGTLGRLVAEHRILIARQQRAPFGVDG
jgi:hypothetical protein